ncbi:MAG TPA: IclR family transcriptional regulator [Caulobacteraceae bacterium]|jgi:DNA-binding IclR family transcriptional regulator|nr:IclR family transcriptional regulator [Caulobacteraceae bacterium]
MTTRTPSVKPGKSDTVGNVKSAERVLSIFEYFEKRRTPRTLSEISQDLDYPVSSALALLRSIQAMGYLTFDFETKTYFPTLSFAMLGHWMHDRLFQGGAMAQMFEHLAAISQETVFLGVQNGLNSQHIHIVHNSQSSLRYIPPVGTLRPLLRSAVGRVLLSHQPKQAVLRIVEKINSLGADEGRVYDPKVVLAELEQVRADGYAFSAGVFADGAAIVSVALPVRPGEVPMAISIGGPSTRITPETVPSLLKLIHASVDEFLTAPRAEETRRTTSGGEGRRAGRA